ncbi:sugar ABC transporter permease [Jatrophihabitans telluris]|uniref:Sugar ABC transporter permease n=1 Tax=Jatrophihabitans telluris TaxID=2038343 RepID=A0ABY4QXR5_9ACTN|nr:sugar ABC transporter permease [Jatrophihabitans telluris]UQX88123.1 sugar ABC transporter permease [Jatrophihabitans telluris]
MNRPASASGTGTASSSDAVPVPGPAAQRAARSGPGRRWGGRATGRRGRDRGRAPLGVALLWLSPALILIAGVVIYPAVELIRASLSSYSITGLRLGSAGGRNYSKVLHHRALATVLKNTGVWVLCVVALTILISLALAQFLSKDFFGRRVVRWAVIVPWAASLVITARMFTLIYDYYHGVLNHALLSVHLISKPIDFLGDDRWTMISMIAVGVFVSIPFTAYVFLAGLNAIPTDIYEAALIDGARPWQVYWSVTLPLLRPAMLVASVLNIIYVFNSFPIVYTLNDRNPGFAHDTSITFMYKLAFKSAEHDVGMSAAAGVFNVLLILVVVMVYLRLVKWQEPVNR